jgi:hypothetical protein
LQEEREKVQQLEDRLYAKDKTISQMHKYHEELCKAYEVAQEELISLKTSSSSF